MSELTYASFMVRLWRDPAGETPKDEEPAWMGEIESVQTGRTWQFRGVEALPELLAEQLGNSSIDSQ